MHLPMSKANHYLLYWKVSQPDHSYNTVLLALYKSHLSLSPLTFTYINLSRTGFCFWDREARLVPQTIAHDPSASVSSAGIIPYNYLCSYFYVYVCVWVYMYVFVSYLCLVLLEVRRGHKIPWNWSTASCEMLCEYWKLIQEHKSSKCS